MSGVQPTNFAARLRHRVSSARWVGVLMCLWMSGCEGPGPVIVLDPLPPERPVHRSWDDDAGFPLPDGVRPCSTDEDCADSIDCTVDTCLPAGYCSNQLDNAFCSDGLVCNGVESCDPQRGCVQAPPPSCDDQDPCTLDRCDEESKDCVHEPRDFDRDGEADYHCTGGTDCDDFDAARGMNAPEICGDAVDNDCDEKIDESVCGRLPHDTCEDPQNISAGGVVELTSIGALGDYRLGCGEAGPSRDMVFVLELAEPHDVKFVASGLRAGGGDDVATLSLQTTCGDVASELQCARGFPGDLRVRSLPAGRYFLIVSSSVGARSILLSTEISPATPPPQNTSCETALDVSAAGHFTGDFVDVADTTALSCSVSGQPDLYYRIVLEEQSDLEVTAISLEADPLAVALRQGGCGDDAVQLRCEVGARMLSRYHQLDPGEYTLVLQGPSGREIGFGLDIAVLPPTPPPEGDTCKVAKIIPTGVAQRLTLANLQDDVASSCESAGADAVLTFTLASAQDLEIDVDSEEEVSIAMQSMCGEPMEERFCRAGFPQRLRLHDVAAGQYYLVLDSVAATSASVRVDTFPVTPTVAVSGNDTCETAYDIPPTGGVFRGDTRMLAQDYTAGCGGGALSRDAAFRLVLTARKHVIASVDATYDAVLLRFDVPLGDPAACSRQDAFCDDGDRTRPQFDLILEPGTYYYIVDGYREGNAGEYVFDVAISDP